MFLTKKEFKKILIMAIVYFALGSICIATAMLFRNMGIDSMFLLILGVISYALIVLIIFFGRYAEGKGKLINLGNQLVRKELKPAAFIREYETLKHADDLVIHKPSVEILQLVAIAYDSLEDGENCLKTIEEMIAVAGEKKRAYANLLKVSVLFSYDRKDEAETIFNEIQKRKLNFTCKALTDAILKGDRAMAMGDYNTVELYELKLLEQSFPKLDNLGKLIAHYRLGEVYEKLQDDEKAVFYYKYCADHGGETAIRVSAKTAIERIQYLK